jgi:hypothetical protein
MGTPVSSTNKTHRHGIAEIVFKVAFKMSIAITCLLWIGV